MSGRRTVLVTGANAGLGLATVLEVARRGFRSVGSVRSVEKGEVVDRAAHLAGVEVETVLLDIDDAERAAEVAEELRPWGLVNNAGFVDQRPVEEVTDDEARRQLETMLVAPVRLARLCLPHMRAAGAGRIVQVSSSSGRVTFPLLGWYQAAKHGLEAISDALRIEVASAGISVVLIEPGGFASAGSEATEEVERLKWIRPLWATPEQVASTVASALTARVPRARYVVGLDAKLNTISDRFTPTIVRDAALRVMYKL